MAGGLILSAVFDRIGSDTAEIFGSNQLRAIMTYMQRLGDPARMDNRARNAWVTGAVAAVIVTGEIATRADHHAYLAAKWRLV